MYSQTQQHQSEQDSSFLVPILVQGEVRTDINVAEGTSFAGVVMAEGGVHTLLLLLARYEGLFLISDLLCRTSPSPTCLVSSGLSS